MDLLQGVKDMEEEKLMSQNENNIPSMEDMPLPTVEDLLKALDGFSGMSEEEKESLRAQLQAGGMQNLVGNQGFSFQQFSVLIALLLVVAFIFVIAKVFLLLITMNKDLEKIQKLKEQLGNIASKIDMLVSMNETEQMKFMQNMRQTLEDKQQDEISNFVLLIVLVGFVFSILVFFGYKLYKSLVEKDRKREEKRKMKQMKKKK